MSLQFRRLVSAYEDQVFSLACYLLHDRSEAEDVAQETFVKLWHRLDEINKHQAKAWLMKVTRNACLDRLRRRRPTTDITETIAATDPGPGQSLQQQQLGEWLQRAITNLKEPYRSLVLLRDVQQNSYQDVATTLELSLDQVKVYLYRARRVLRERLQEVST